MKTRIIVFVCIALTWACSKDSTEDSSRITVEFSEYPGRSSIIANLESSLGGEVTFSISSESVDGAFSVNRTSGLLVTWDPLAFDYEVSPVVTGIVTATNGTESEDFEITVNILDEDDIASFLTVSLASYQAANPGEWIEVTEEEFDDIANNLLEISYVGTPNGAYGSITFLTLPNQTYRYLFDRTIANQTPPMPANEYLFAFRYISGTASSNNTKVKVSLESNTAGFETVGTPLPTHGENEVFFVLKGSEVQFSDPAYIGMFSEGRMGYNLENSTQGNCYIRIGDVSTIADSNSAEVLTKLVAYQGLSTPLKQWD